jgi:MarR family transcriptional regulator, transcriptional regulator for hemolysin
MAPNDIPGLPTSSMKAQDAAAQMEPNQPLTPPGLARAFGFLVHDLSRLIKRRFERRARQMGLPITRQQAAVILNIAGNQGVSQAEVATWLGIEPIALVRMLDKLHEEGLVERRAHPTDRRIRTLWLTPAAGVVVERILAINEAIRQEAFAGLPPETRVALIEVLGRIKDNLVLQEEVACDQSRDGSEAAGAAVPGK